jgi:hypothetical protein
MPPRPGGVAIAAIGGAVDMRESLSRRFARPSHHVQSRRAASSD